MARQLISSGEKVTFKRQCVRVDVAHQHRIRGCFYEIIGRKKVPSLQVMRDVVKSLAFAHGEGNLINVALRQLPENVAAADRAIEEIFSSFERTFRMP